VPVPEPGRRGSDKPSDFPGTAAHIGGAPWLGWRTGVLLLYIQMHYEWDARKNRLNKEKHGFSFEMAALVFEDEACLVRPDRIDDTGEQRWHAIGAVRIEPGAEVVLLVVHVYREETDGEEITRIISARKAEKNDVRRYQGQKME
jgi:uncharacterized DUF497 family protein